MSICIAVINQKGGVGKTATAYNLAYILGLQQEINLIDLDPSGNATKGLTTQSIFDYTSADLLTMPLSPKHCSIIPFMDNKLSLVPATINLALTQRTITYKPFRESLLARSLERDLDTFMGIYIIDCPPTLSDLTINAMYAANFIIIPLRYEEDAMEGMIDLFSEIKEIKEGQKFDYRILKNGHDARKTIMIEHVESKLKDLEKNGKVFNTLISQCEDIVLAKSKNLPVFRYSHNSRAARDYLSLAMELKEIINGAY